MNRKAVLALLIAIVLPLAGYYTMKYFGKDAVIMPKHYFHDSVIISGKKPDTIWHQVNGISFTNQLGQKVQLKDLHGKVLVLNFFFTRCPSICPGLTKNMKKLQKSFVKNADIVQFLSVSVDPEHDSVPNLRKYADKFDINHDSWWFLTGNKEEIYKFGLGEMKASIADSGVDTAFIHTENFFLLDSNRVIRGWYNGFDTARLKQLARDIPTLMLEKDRKSPSIFREFIPYLPVIFIGIGLLILVMNILQKIKRKD